LADAADVPVTVLTERGVDATTSRRLAKVIAARRSVRPLQPLPALTRSPAEVANEERVQAIEQALARARRHTEVAEWDACAKEAGDKLGEATELLSSSGRLDLLRDLHVQIGACMVLGSTPYDATPHFQMAVLLDESALPSGLHRLEAEQAHEQARGEVLGRVRGAVRIETVPPGAEVWIDGRKAPGVTPHAVEVRLGHHFVTLRRFRYEPLTSLSLLHPGNTLKLVLSPARRDTLRQQLAEVGAGKRTVPATALRLARAQWSGAAQLVVVAAQPGLAQSDAARRVRVTLVEAQSGQVVRERLIDPGLDDEGLMVGVCALLGEHCEPSRAVPWYFWPVAGAAVVGAAVAVGFALDAARETRFCPANGCQ
jgi:hypothetical protein